MKFDVVIIGSGCAGYSTADWLFSFGFKNIAIVTENRLAGTSRNTGSDKQTYYKMCIDGQNADSAKKMAESMIASGSANGELAYIEALNSVKCFNRLVSLGVEFPTDDYGGYVGYQTDHDITPRATSIGPYTSKKMTECLEQKVLVANKTKLLDNLTVVQIVVQNGECKGVLCFDSNSCEHIFLQSDYVVACTGAPSSIYESSVYPCSQTGMTGTLIQAGCKMCNFTEWQYGIASIGVRWNVSGSYMQVLPRFVSVDKDGNCTEFLKNHLTDEEVIRYTFLKGYEWPFDVKKRENSSKIDTILLEEMNKGNKVYLDFTQNPSGYDRQNLPSVAKEYLDKCGSLQDAPIERLIAMNEKAYQLFLDNHINLKKDKLQIAVCAQHNNGGVLVNRDWQTSVKRLFAVGEVAGTFGITRPGGSALNSTQVGGLQVARYLSRNYCTNEVDTNLVQNLIEGYNSNFQSFVAEDENFSEVPMLMSKYAGISREYEKIVEILQLINQIKKQGVKAKSYLRKVKAKDMLLCCEALCKNIVESMGDCGSRGGSECYKNGVFLQENEHYRNYLNVFDGKSVEWVDCPKVPEYKAWFEVEYNKNKKGEHYEGYNFDTK